MIWFTSDTHFGHANVIKFDNRPFTNIDEHDQGLIKNWNSVVGKGDVVYHLGDVMSHKRNEWFDNRLDEVLGALHGTLILILGNHDLTNPPIMKHKRWSKVCHYQEITYLGQKIVLFHYRMVVWNRSHHGSWALHGHSHGSLPVNYQAKTFDVGTMCWDYHPISFDQVAEEMSKHTFVPVDGHKGDL